MAPQGPNLSNLDLFFLQKVHANMDSGGVFFCGPFFPFLDWTFQGGAVFPSGGRFILFRGALVFFQGGTFLPLKNARLNSGGPKPP